ncbi:MAG TPA: protein-tyrosine-phosphatase [Cytophagales bacterium]|nr:protein-tyrosine-phosphatase [Cytophagales bacterium]HAA17982.1 protein-tyrosine-phosphatase [Cytophagales bacterium]HAP64727.1 protein-tyrosine-phosphatase [Cytophagales bacterium]
MNAQLTSYLDSVVQSVPHLPAERIAQLDQIATFVSQSAEDDVTNLVFICTHNSRRSHMSQLWAATAAAYYGVTSVHTFSGGTEATAFNPRAVAAMQRAGFSITNPGGTNPMYQVRWAADADPMLCFSKRYDDVTIPYSNTVAVMTCSDADKNCPLIPGVDLRVSLPFVDPKAADGTPAEAAAYDERAFQIATEMTYLMQQIAGA